MCESSRDEDVRRGQMRTRKGENKRRKAENEQHMHGRA
jgi:hypothetical protein